MDISNSPWHYAVELLQIIELIFAVILIWSLTSAYFCFVCYLEFHCSQIVKELDVLKDELNIKQRYRDFARIIGRHRFTILYWNNICDMFKFPFFGIATVGSVTLGLIGITLLIVQYFYHFQFQKQLKINIRHVYRNFKYLFLEYL